MENMHGKTLESKDYEKNDFKSHNKFKNVKSTSINHIVPHSILNEKHNKDIIYENELVGNKVMNEKIGDNLDPHVVKNGKGEFELSANTINSINKYNPKERKELNF
jgi:hypothetical protein